MERENLTGRILREAVYLAVATSIAYSGSSCSLFHPKSDRESCIEYVNRLNEQMNQEGRRINDRFGNVDFSCSR